jgi:hypothetical protein
MRHRCGIPKLQLAAERSIAALLTTILVLSPAVFAQSGGQYSITQSVIAGGGGKSDSGTFSVTGTIGQAAAGGEHDGPPFSHQSGFWTRDVLRTTAAAVSISGRVLTSNRRGLTNATVTVVAMDGSTRSVRTSTFGYFKIEGLTAGELVIVNVASRRYRFEPQAISLMDSVAGVTFIPTP